MDNSTLPVPPASPAARAALKVATEYLTRALLNHSIRSWYWSLGFAEVEGIADLDEELLYVAAVLHDIALVEPFDSHLTAFEFAGGDVASVLAAGAEWSEERRRHLAAAIVAHMASGPVPEGGVEGHLLDVATGLDISGAQPDALPHDYLTAVLDRYPRLDLATDFARRAEDQAERKPESQAARIVRNGVAQKLLDNPLEG